MKNLISRGLVLTIFFIGSLCFSMFFIEQTKFDLSYRVINREREMKYKDSKGNMEYYYYLHCNNDLGTFKIDVDKSTYDSKSYGSYVRFTKPFTSSEMLRYAVNDKTEKNVIDACTNDTEKFLIRNTLLSLLMLFGCFASPIAFIYWFFKSFETN